LETITHYKLTFSLLVVLFHLSTLLYVFRYFNLCIIVWYTYAGDYWQILVNDYKLLLTGATSTTVLSFKADRSCILSFSPSLVRGADRTIRNLRLKRWRFPRFTHINYSTLNFLNLGFCSLFSNHGFQFSVILNVKWRRLLTVIIFINNSWFIMANWSELLATDIRSASFLSKYCLIF
jgi:hypothetical protein